MRISIGSAAIIDHVQQNMAPIEFHMKGGLPVLLALQLDQAAFAIMQTEIEQSLDPMAQILGTILPILGDFQNTVQLSHISEQDGVFYRLHKRGGKSVLFILKHQISPDSLLAGKAFIVFISLL